MKYMKKDKENLGNRMKKYEVINRNFLIPKLPTVIRLDGKAFHTFTKQFKKPFDNDLINCMNQAALYACENIQGAKFAYVQSDEISIYISDRDSLEQQMWYDGNIQKMVSVSASMASNGFNKQFFLDKLNSLGSLILGNNINYDTIIKGTDYDKLADIKLAEFDSRVFQMPNNEELLNCFLWRQQDCVRNSISSVAQYNFSNKELHKKSTKDMLQMLYDKGIHFEKYYTTEEKRGRFISKKTFINDIEVAKKGDDDTNKIWHQPDNQGIYPSKHGRALMFAKTTDGDVDWCDIPIEKIRSKWVIEGCLDIKENREVFKRLL